MKLKMASKMTNPFQESSALAGEYAGDESCEDFSEGSDIELRDLEEYDRGQIVESHPVVAKQKKTGDVTQALQKVTKEIAHFDAGDEEEIGSEEEKDILKGIRDEIENKVREEMKDELEGFRHKMKAIENGQIPSAAVNDDETEGVQEMDPKLKEAYIKMRKLDKILKKKVKKERRVKRDRLLLERRMKEEISGMQHGATHYKDIKTNTERFLALTLPPSHNEGIDIDKAEEDEDIPPLFATQINDEVLWGKDRPLEEEEDISKLDEESQAGDSCNNSTRAGTRASKAEKKGKQKPKKDFIKRNKELAAEADQVVAMTDDEKQRLEGLLGDVDDMPELPQLDGDYQALFEGDAFALSIAGEGFRPDNIEQKSLTNIDHRLRSIMPDDSFRSIMDNSFSGTKSVASQPPLFSRVGITSGAEIPDRFGERVLYETKEERELKARLDSIEGQLDRFKAQNDVEHSEGQSQLTDDQLDRLLDQCARDFSRMSHSGLGDVDASSSHLDTPDLSARSQVSSRQSMMENPPKLSDEQLQQLLSEAHFPLSSVLMSLRDDDQKMEEEKGNAETIKASTWKAISEEDVEGSCSTPVNDSQGNASHNNSSKPSSIDYNTDIFIGGDKNIVSSENMSSHGHHNASSLQHSSQSEMPTLPRIPANMSAWASFSSDNTPSATPSSSAHLSNSEDFTLPDIRPNSSLIQAVQGMNNESRKGSGSLPSRRPLDMVHNDLSVSENSRNSLNSMEDFDQLRSVNSSRNSSRLSNGSSNLMSNGNNTSPYHVPKPPTKENRTSSRP